MSGNIDVNVLKPSNPQKNNSREVDVSVVIKSESINEAPKANIGFWNRLFKWIL